MWQGKNCTICHRNKDSLTHIANCSTIRRIWAMLFPNLAFDGLDLIGFTTRDYCIEDRVLLSILLHGIYDFVRFWSHSERQHYYDDHTLVHAIIHFAITGNASHNQILTRNALNKLRMLLVRPRS